MSETFIARLCALVTAPRRLEDWERREVLTAFEDTMAVAYAGWHDPVVQSLLKVYRGHAAPLIDGSKAQSVEHAALIHATAGHALDYDDVQLTTVSHPSVPIVPALLAVAQSRPGLEDRMATAFAIGVTVNIALGRVMGFSHYNKGWHATSTLGPVATAAALAHLLSLDEEQTRHALAIAAIASGGMQRNFGTMSKPLQAGTASAGGVRAALLADAGMTGSEDIFGPRGFFHLYGGEEAGDDPATVSLDIEIGVLARKLYPCCYMNHRLISAAFDAREQLGGMIPANATIRVKAPFGSTVPLWIHDPQDGLQAKFCGPYSIACALAQGAVSLSDFEDEAVHRPSIRALMTRINLSEDPREDAVMIGLDTGAVRLRVEADGQVLAHSEIVAYPGSPKRPATEAEMEAKIADCLGIYRRRLNGGPSVGEFRTELRRNLGMAEAHA